MLTKIDIAGWKKYRLPRKLKKRLKKEHMLSFYLKMLRLQNMGRFLSYHLGI